MPITRKDLNPEFKFEVAARPGGQYVKRCFECGTRACVCPVSESTPEFDARRIIHMIRLGLKDRLLRSDAIWMCSHCETCAYVCPQGIQFDKVIDVLREMALSEGYVSREAFELWGAGPCKAACPAHISIPGFVSHIAQGRYADGLRLIKRDMPFPSICGRVCPHPCEAKCNRGRADQPVGIMALKRFLGDMQIGSSESFAPPRKAQRQGRVAVVGAGPAGLSAAYYLAIEGLQVTVLEKLPVAGGMMVAGIPEYRLPRDVLAAEIEDVRRLGVEIRLGCEVGRDVTFEELRRDFQAVFIAAGCHKGLSLGIPGEDGLDGVADGVAFLREINLGRPPGRKGRLLVVGGGNVAIDCARVARRLRFDDVTVVYRRTREEMPASRQELDEALEEGVRFEFLTAPVEILGEQGRAIGLKCRRMRLGEPDASNRRRPEPVEGSELVLKADVVLKAIGQTTDLSFLCTCQGLGFTKKDLVEADPLTGETGAPGIFAGGDAVAGPRTVVEAVAFGREVAVSIDRFLKGEDIRAGRGGKEWAGIEFTPESPVPLPREVMPRLSPAECARSFKEIHLGFKEPQARREAERCRRICGSQARD